MAALRAGRIGWDIGSTADIPADDYTSLIIELFKEGEPGYVELLEELCAGDDQAGQEEENPRFRRIVAIVKH